MATALKQHANEHLTELDIGYNEIKDDGACAIAQVHRIQHCSRMLSQCFDMRQTMNLIQHEYRYERKPLVPAVLRMHDADSSAAVSRCVCWAAGAEGEPTGAPKELKINSNYITRFGQTALTEALDMVYEMGGNREIVITY